MFCQKKMRENPLVMPILECQDQVEVSMPIHTIQHMEENKGV